MISPGEYVEEEEEQQKKVKSSQYIGEKTWKGLREESVKEMRESSHRTRQGKKKEGKKGGYKWKPKEKKVNIIMRYRLV